MGNGWLRDFKVVTAGDLRNVVMSPRFLYNESACVAASQIASNGRFNEIVGQFGYDPFRYILTAVYGPFIGHLYVLDARGCPSATLEC